MGEEKKRIIVIEDNEADATLIEEALSTAGVSYEVTRFCDGADALSVLLEDSPLPDAILLDLNMPRSDGLDVLLRIRNTPRLTRIPVGILTGSELGSDEKRASYLGASHYMHKPKSYESFVNKVRNTVEQMLAP